MGGLIFAFLVKDVGAAWDAAYHFKYFRDFLQLPHIVNGFGDVVAIGLLSYFWFREPKRTHPDLKIIMYGIVVFIGAIFFDQWYHTKFGVDLTTWSPSHFMLYAGTLISLLGSFLYVLWDYRHSRVSLQVEKGFGIAFSYLILSCIWFPLLQQEQGVIVDYSLRHGVRLADPELLNLFFKTQHDVYSGLPGWLYGAYAVLSAVFIFKLVKLMNLHKFGVTIVAGLYLLNRFIMNTIFIISKYPTSTLPYYLVIVAFIFDLSYNVMKKKIILRDIVTSSLPLAGIMLLGLLNPEFPIHPPIPLLQTFLFSIPATIIGYFAAVWIYNSLFREVLKMNE